MTTETRDDEQPQPLARTVGRLTVLNVVFALLGFVTAPIQARALGPAGRGDLAAIVTPLTFLAWVGDFGLFTFAAREVARKRPVAVLTGTIGGTCALLGVVLALLMLPMAFFLARGRDVVLLWLLIGLALLPLAMFGGFLNAIARGSGHWTAWIAARSFAAFGGAAGLVLLFAFDRLTVTTAAACVLGVGWLAVVFLLPVLRGAGRPHADRNLLRAGIPYGLRAWLTGLAGLTNQRVDQLVMVPLVSSRELGLYAVAVTVATATSTFSSAVTMPLMPRVAADGPNAVPRVLRIALLVVLLGSVVLAAVAYPVVVFALGDEFRRSVPMIWLLVVAGLPLSGVSVLTQAFLGAGSPAVPGKAEALALAVTVPGLLLFVREHGGVAAALVSLAAYGLAFAYLVRHAHRDFGIPVADLLVPRGPDVGWLRDQVLRRLRRRR
jgi:O-antigen/teichoic acid export membrane protein